MSSNNRSEFCHAVESMHMRAPKFDWFLIISPGSGYSRVNLRILSSSDLEKSFLSRWSKVQKSNFTISGDAFQTMLFVHKLGTMTVQIRSIGEKSDNRMHDARIDPDLNKTEKKPKENQAIRSKIRDWAPYFEVSVHTFPVFCNLFACILPQQNIWLVLLSQGLDVIFRDKPPNESNCLDCTN